MKVYVITGGFGSGKSTVSQMFRKLGVPVLDTDLLAHEAIKPGKSGYTEVLRLFGKSILSREKIIDRKKLGKIVFQDPKARKKLEKILHPRVRRQVAAEISRLKKEKLPIAMVEIPLLFETGWHRTLQYDGIITLVSEPETQILRGMSKHRLSREEVLHRMAAQLPNGEKIPLSNFVIKNNGTLKALERSVKQLLRKLISTS